MCSIPSLRPFPNVALETVPMFVYLTMALSRPFKEDRLANFHANYKALDRTTRNNYNRRAGEQNSVKKLPTFLPSGLQSAVESQQGWGAVSYTHLTLPTMAVV